MKKISIIVTVLLLAVAILAGCDSAGNAVAKEGDTVQIDYTGMLSDGTVFDSSEGSKPLEFTLGEGKVIPGFEKAVLGMKVGEKKTVTIAAEDAYGPRLDEMIIDVPISQMEDGVEPQVGMQLQSTASDGAVVVVTVIKITDTTFTVDANHPLAGKDLTFQIELVKIL